LTLTSNTHGSFPVHVRKNIDHGIPWSSDIPNHLIEDRLANRARSFQERILGPRVSFFGERELYFQCREEDRCECIMADRIRVRSRRRLSSRMLARLSLSEAPCKGISFGELWSSVLEEYTPLDLMFEKDRLPAFAGIASLVESFEPGRYVVGLWEKELPYQLLWELQQTSFIGIHMPEMDIEHRRASIYPPSFSWTSWITQIEYYHTAIRPIPMCEVVEIKTVVPGLHKYGEVTYAHIKLKGQLVPAEPL
jgi:hypothetical protein